eukprot:636124-Pyramimonas_sp.AAC.2
MRKLRTALLDNVYELGFGPTVYQTSNARVACVISAKVPIIKCVEASSNLSIDISLGAANGCATVEFVLAQLRRCDNLTQRAHLLLLTNVTCNLFDIGKPF